MCGHVRIRALCVACSDAHLCADTWRRGTAPRRCRAGGGLCATRPRRTSSTSPAGSASFTRAPRPRCSAPRYACCCRMLLRCVLIVLRRSKNKSSEPLRSPLPRAANTCRQLRPPLPPLQPPPPPLLMPAMPARQAAPPPWLLLRPEALPAPTAPKQNLSPAAVTVGAAAAATATASVRHAHVRPTRTAAIVIATEGATRMWPPATATETANGTAIGGMIGIGSMIAIVTAIGSGSLNGSETGTETGTAGTGTGSESARAIGTGAIMAATANGRVTAVCVVRLLLLFNNANSHIRICAPRNRAAPRPLLAAARSHTDSLSHRPAAWPRRISKRHRHTQPWTCTGDRKAKVY